MLLIQRLTGTHICIFMIPVRKNLLTGEYVYFIIHSRFEMHVTEA